MATYYVSSVDGNNADDGLSWANAKQSVAGALAVATTTGDVILVDSAHDFNPAGATISWNPSASVHVSVISVNRATGDHLAGAKERTNDFSGHFFIMTSGSASMSLYVEGMTLASSGGDGHFRLATGADAGSLEMVNCRLEQRGAWTYFEMGSRWDTYKVPRLKFIGCTFAWYTYSDPTMLDFTGSCTAEFIGCSLDVQSGSPGGTSLISLPAAGQQHSILFLDCDLSGYTQSKPLISGAANLKGGAPFQFVNCKLHANSTLAPSGTFSPAQSGSVTYIDCDSANTTYKYACYTREGALTVSTSIYASSGAAVDTNSLSWAIVTTSLASEQTPFITPWLAKWINAAASTAFSVELVYDSATNLTDREVWAELEVLENASYPLGTVTRTRNANPFTGTATDLAAGAATWTGTGGFSNENKDKIAATRTVARKGVARARLCIAKASQTLYVDPQLRAV